MANIDHSKDLSVINCWEYLKYTGDQHNIDISLDKNGTKIFLEIRGGTYVKQFTDLKNLDEFLSGFTQATKLKGNC